MIALKWCNFKSRLSKYNFGRAVTVVADVAIVAGVGRRIPVFAIAALKHSQHVKRSKFKSHARARVDVVSV